MCKWVLLRSSLRQMGEVQHVQTEYKPVLSSSFPGDLLQHLIIMQKALPLTPDMDSIMDDMEVWGHGKCYDWYCDVLELLASTIQHGIAVQRKAIFRACIEYRVKVVLHSRFAYNSPVADHILNDWTMYFQSSFTTQGLRQMTITSEQFVLYRMAQTMHTGCTVGSCSTVVSVNSD